MVETDFEQAMRHISGIVENPDMYGYLSGYDNLLIHARACGVAESRVQEVAELVGMQMRIREKFKSYSLGMKQRLGVAQALLHNPKVMILDEPTNGLDPAGIKEFRDLLRGLAHSQGLAVLVSSHILQEMQLMCDRVGIISKGCLKQVATMEELTHAGQGGVYRYTARPMETFRQLLEANAADRIVAAAADHMDIRIAEDEIPGFNRRLMENQVDIYGLSPVGTTLEETFIEITGGGNIIG